MDNATLNRFFSLHHLLPPVLHFDLNVLPPGAEQFWQGQEPPPFQDNDSEESDDESTDSSDLDTDYDLTDDESTDSSGSSSDDESTDSSGSSSDDMDCSEGTPPPEGNESRLIIFL